jgi:transcriptional regulator with XRE-family HTH domain
VNDKNNEYFGERLRALRQRSGLSLREVARQSQLTPSFVSQVELNQVQPSITTLKRLCDAIGATIIDVLYDTHHPARSVVRRDARQRLVTKNKEVDIELLAEAPGRPFDVLLVRLAPKASTSDEPHSHNARECIYVISGKARVDLADHSETLVAGDSIYYASAIPHRVVNIGRGDLVIVDCLVGDY